MSSHALVLVPRAPPSRRVRTAEARLASMLSRVEALEGTVEALARDLASFERRYAEVTGEAFAALDRAERLARRVQRLEDELSRLAAAARTARRPTPPDRGGHPPCPAGPSAPRAAAEAARPAEPVRLRGAVADVKALYRRLARLLHPDLAQGDAAERARRSDLMARANEAYARRDLAALELLAERIGASAPDRELGEEERLAHATRRAAALRAAHDALAAERERLLGSRSARLLEETRQRAAAGGDLLAEARAAADARARAARTEALVRLERLLDAARTLSVRSAARRGSAAAGEPGALLDAAAASPLVRPGQVAPDVRRSTPAARALARTLTDDAARTPWRAALVLLAWMGELASPLPPPLASRAGLEERWDALRAGWPGAPDLADALSRLPVQLEVGLRLRGDRIEAGLQLSSAELGAGVRAALRREAVRELAARALASLGPRLRCRACDDEVYGVHLLRVRGLDELHGLACPRCAAVLRSYWLRGDAGGIEALAPVARLAGLVAVQEVRLGGATLGFEMLPVERARLTARSLARRFHDLCLAPAGIALPREAVRVFAGRLPLSPGARVPEGLGVALQLGPGAGLSAPELVSALSARASGRFRS